jgi:hypothetical protein
MALKDVLWLSESDVETLLDFQELLTALADGFKSMSAGQVIAQRGRRLPFRRVSCCQCRLSGRDH